MVYVEEPEICTEDCGMEEMSNMHESNDDCGGCSSQMETDPDYCVLVPIYDEVTGYKVGYKNSCDD